MDADCLPCEDPVLQTERLDLRRLAVRDAAFILELLNDAAFLAHIGDRGVRTLDDARAYIENGPVASYARHGFGLYLVERRADARALGICGLVKRETLADVDIGFAFMPAYRACGYGRESAAAVLGHAHTVLGLKRVVAIVAPGNTASAALVESLGLRFERMFRHAEDTEALRLFAWQA